MKNSYFVGLFLLWFQLNAQINFNKDSLISAIEGRIALPKIPGFSVDVTRLGAKGDGISNSKKAFDKAMKACAKNNGGTIFVPKGNYKINGPIHFGYTGAS